MKYQLFIILSDGIMINNGRGSQALPFPFLPESCPSLLYGTPMATKNVIWLAPFWSRSPLLPIAKQIGPDSLACIWYICDVAPTYSSTSLP